MSSAILNFQQPSEANEQALDPAILVAAVEESPEPIALTENGKLIYANRSFAQLSADSPDATSASLIISGVQVASSLHEGCDRLRAGEYSAVVIDQWSTQAEPEPTNVLFDHLGTAVPLFVNFGISGVERILRELRAALSRRGLETILTRHSARLALRDELKDDVTALLLCCGIGVEEPGLSESAVTRLRKIEELANQIKSKLAISEG